MSDTDEDLKRLARLSGTHRTSNGGTGFMHVNVGHILTILTIFASFFVAYGALKERFKAAEEKVESNKARLDEIDRSGTAASRHAVALDHQMIMAHEARIQKMEEAVSSLAVMKDQMIRMSEDIRSIKQKQP